MGRRFQYNTVYSRCYHGIQTSRIVCKGLNIICIAYSNYVVVVRSGDSQRELLFSWFHHRGNDSQSG